MALSLDGSTGISFPAGGTGNPAGATVGTTDTQTLTNKTITAPVLSGTATGTYTLAGTPTITSPTITGASMSSMASSVITSGTANTSLSGTAIDFTGIPSWAKRITLMFSGVSTSGTNQYLLQLGTASSIETSSYLGSTQYAASATENDSAGFLITTNSGGSASILLHGMVTISLLNSSTNLWTCSGVMGSSFDPRCYMIAGSKALAGTLTRIRITNAAGADTFDAGSINILYE